MLPGAARAEGAAYRVYPDNLFGISLGASTAVASGYHGAVLVAGADGRAWSPVDSGASDLFRRVAQIPGHGFAAVSNRGRILAGDAAGREWHEVFAEEGQNLRSIAFVDGDVGYAVGHNGLVLRSGDSGKTWAVSPLEGYAGRDLPRLNGVAVVDEKRAVTVGEFGVVAATSDGGATWKVVTEQAYPTLIDVAMAGDHGYAVGLNGTLLSLSVADDGTWTVAPVASGVSQHLLSVALSADGSKGLVGGNGLLLSLAGGKFRPATVPDAVPLSYLWIGGVAIAADGHAVAVGQGGLILRADAPDGAFEAAALEPSLAPVSYSSAEKTQ